MINMIKINLLAEGKRPAAVRRAGKEPSGSRLEGGKAGLIKLLIALLVPVAGAGAFLFKLH